MRRKRGSGAALHATTNNMADRHAQRPFRRQRRVWLVGERVCGGGGVIRDEASAGTWKSLCTMRYTNTTVNVIPQRVW